VCPRSGGRRDRPSSPEQRLWQLSGIEDTRLFTAGRREPGDPLCEERVNQPCANVGAKAESTTTAGTASPTGLPQRCVAAHRRRYDLCLRSF
jgi:hypothetical protein